MKLPWLTANEIIKILVKQGFTIRNQVGSHVHLVGVINGARRMVTVPVMEIAKLRKVLC